MHDRIASLHKRFTTASSPTPEWLQAAARELLGLPHAERFRATIRLRSDPDVELEYDTPELWNQDVGTRIADASAALIQVWVEGGSWELRIEFDRREMDLHGWRVGLETVQSTRDRLVSALSLRERADTQAAGKTPQREGVRKQFEVAGGGITSAWLTAALGALAAEIDVAGSVNARCRLAQDPQNEVFYENWPAWRSAIEAHLTKGDLVEFHVWAWGNGAELSCTCDVRRELVTLEIRRAQRAEVDQAIARLTAAMNLKALSSHPYHVRRYTRVYKLKAWTSARDFLTGLDKAIRLAFPRPPAVADANVTRGKETLDREPATNLDAFRKLVTDAGNDISGLYLVLEGMRERYLGVGMNRPESRFEIWTSLGRSDWGPVAKALEDALELELREEKASENGKSESWRTEFVKIAATAILASGGTYCTTEGVQLWLPHPQIVITSPPMLDDKSSSPTEGGVLVAWHVRTNRWKSDHILPRPPLARIVVQDASGNPIVDTTGAASGTVVRVPVGDFDLAVTIESLGISSRLTLHVKDSASIPATGR